MFIKGTYTSVGVFFDVFFVVQRPCTFLSEKYKVWGTTFYIEFRRIACVSKRCSGFVFAATTYIYEISPITYSYSHFNPISIAVYFFY